MARPRLVSDEQILGSMRTCVLERGAGVSLDVVARELGVTGPALLKRFGSRRELMVEALRPQSEPPILEELAHGPDERPLRPQLEALFTRIWEHLSELIPCALALREAGVPPEEIYHRRKDPLRLITALQAWLQAARSRHLVGPAGLETAAIAMIGAVQARVISTHLIKRSFALRAHRAYLKDLSRLFARALAPAMGAPKAMKKELSS